MLSIRSLAHNSRPRYLIPLFIVLLQCVKAQTSTATWLYPTTGTVTINNIDTIILEWTSNYEEAWLLMWCQIDGPGPNVSLGTNVILHPDASRLSMVEILPNLKTRAQIPSTTKRLISLHHLLTIPCTAGISSRVSRPASSQPFRCRCR